jgi:hypothetical protein
MTYKVVPLPKPHNLAIPEHPNLMYIVQILIMLTLLFILAVQGQAAAEDQNLPQLAVVVVEAHTVRV